MYDQRYLTVNGTPVPLICKLVDKYICGTRIKTTETHIV